MIANDFHDYMNITNLQDLNFFDRKMLHVPDDCKYHAYRWVLETAYNIESRHDFIVKQPIDEAYKDVMQKINRRIQRFYATLQRTDITVFFVRIMVTREQAVRFRSLIRSKFPHLKFIFVALSNTSDFQYNWDEHNIRNFYFNNPVYQWDEHSKSWHSNSGSFVHNWNIIVEQLLSNLQN